jgi:hypothetical protein
MEVPYRQIERISLSRLASGKLVLREQCSEGSRAAKVCTEEHELHMRLVKLGKHAHQCKA